VQGVQGLCRVLCRVRIARKRLAVAIVQGVQGLRARVHARTHSATALIPEKNRFLAVKKHRCGHKRKRHMVGATTKQSTFIFPPGVDEEPPGSSQQVFFSECIDAFRNALNDYKQGLSRAGF